MQNALKNKAVASGATISWASQLIIPILVVPAHRPHDIALAWATCEIDETDLDDFLDVVDEQTGVMEHVDDLLYRRDLVLADVHPLVEAVYQLLSDILARNSDNVTIGLQ